jgi:hypothetical protein
MLTEGSPLMREGRCLVHGGAKAEIVADFIEGRTEARSTGEAAEAAHGIVTLFHAAMILFESVVKILAGAVEDLAAERAADGSGVGSMLIGGHALRLVSDGRGGLLENIPCRCGILPGEKLNEARCACSGSCSTILTCIPEK